MRTARSFARASAGKSIEARIAIMAITTNNSIRVKPTEWDSGGFLRMGMREVEHGRVCMGMDDPIVARWKGRVVGGEAGRGCGWRMDLVSSFFCCCRERDGKDDKDPRCWRSQDDDG